MACVIPLDFSYPNHELTSLTVSVPNMLIPAKTASNAAKIALFPLCVLPTVSDYLCSPDANFTALPLFVLKI